MITVRLTTAWREYAKDSRIPCAPDYAVQLVNLGVAEIEDAALVAELQANGKLKKPGEAPKESAPAPKPPPRPKETFTPKTYRRKKSA